jgi:hypothetical protein
VQLIGGLSIQIPGFVGVGGVGPHRPGPR